MMAVPGLVVGIQDMGAAGLTCSTCETASRGGAGIEIELDRVPQREDGDEFLRDHAFRVPGADARHRAEGARARDRGGLRQMGPPRRPRRNRHGHGPHGGAPARRRCRGHPCLGPHRQRAYLPSGVREARLPGRDVGHGPPRGRAFPTSTCRRRWLPSRGSFPIPPSLPSAGSTASTTTWCSTEPRFSRAATRASCGSASARARSSSR